MSQENVEVVRRAFEALAEGDLGILFRLADPDVCVRPRPAEPDAAEEYRGLDGLMEYAINWYSQWDEYESEPIEILDAGDQVVVRARERGFVERTGVEVREDFSHTFRFRDGKVVE
jgi:ketosteroid isomerase-like protein